MAALRFRAACSCALVLLGVTSAHAEDWMFLSGVDVGGQHSNYAMVGLLAPLPGYRLGKGWVARGLVDGLTYRYDKNNTDIDATAFGGEASLGWMNSNEDGWFGLYAGAVLRETDLSPDDPGSEARGTKASARFSAEGERKFGADWKVGAMASYSAFADNSYWNRVRVLYRFDDSIFAGPEATYQGSDDYSAWGVGAALVGIKLGERGELGMKAGMRKAEDVSASPYAGLELGWMF